MLLYYIIKDDSIPKNIFFLLFCILKGDFRLAYDEYLLSLKSTSNEPQAPPSQAEMSMGPKLLSNVSISRYSLSLARNTFSENQYDN